MCQHHTISTFFTNLGRLSYQPRRGEGKKKKQQKLVWKNARPSSGIERGKGAGWSRYNTKNGGPAPEKLTDEVYENTKKISKYHIVGEALQVDISKLGTSKFLVQHAHTQKFGNFVVEVPPAPCSRALFPCQPTPFLRYPRRCDTRKRSARVSKALKPRPCFFLLSQGLRERGSGFCL